jgi:hypothetical protein
VSSFEVIAFFLLDHVRPEMMSSIVRAYPICFGQHVLWPYLHSANVGMLRGFKVWNLKIVRWGRHTLEMTSLFDSATLIAQQVNSHFLQTVNRFDVQVVLHCRYNGDLSRLMTSKTGIEVINCDLL